VDDARPFEGNPLADLISSRVLQAAKALEGQPYVWSAAGPGPITVTKVAGYVPVSPEQYLDGLDFRWAIRRAAEIRAYLRELWQAGDDATAFRVCRAYCLRVATSELRYRREYEAQRCPHCGCHPDEHGRDG
jgi:hypothetical protein